MCYYIAMKAKYTLDPQENINLEAAKKLRAIAKALENGKIVVAEYEYAKVDNTIHLEIEWTGKKKKKRSSSYY